MYASARFSGEDLEERYYGASIANPTKLQHERKAKSFALYDRLLEGRLARPLPGARALDIGCNNGAMLDVLKAEGYEAEGTETCESLARATGTRHTVHAVDACAPGSRLGQQYELILMSHVLEHMVRPMATLNFVERHLAPGGVVVIEVPNWHDPARLLWGRFFRPLELGDHVVFYERETLGRALDHAGLDVMTLWSRPQGATLVMPSLLSVADLGWSLMGGQRATDRHVASQRVATAQISTTVRNWALRLLDRLDPYLERATSQESAWGANLIAVASRDRRACH